MEKDIRVGSMGKLGELDFASREAYNVLRTNLAFALPGTEGGKSVGLTSPDPGDGKSYTAVNLAVALSNDGFRVLLISADLRRSSIEEKVGLDTKVGLSNILTGNVADYKKAMINQADHKKLFIIPAGEVPPNPSALLGSENMRKFISDMKEDFDYVICDLPPVNSVIDPVAVSRFLDGMIVVVRHGVTRKQSLNSAMRQLEYANAKVLGFVYNDYGSGSSRYGKYGYRKYGYRKYGRSGQYYKKYGYGYYTNNEKEKSK